MDYVTWVAVGLVAGAVARIVHPGKDPGGCLVTPALGVAGAFLGGFLSRELGLGDVRGFDVRSVGIAAAGALLLLIVYRAAFGKKSD
jgi:uncharacterized membrane protein YeaQ/YmgE (transglycosylase-associated protein family)